VPHRSRGSQKLFRKCFLVSTPRIFSAHVEEQSRGRDLRPIVSSLENSTDRQLLAPLKSRQMSRSFYGDRSGQIAVRPFAIASPKPCRSVTWRMWWAQILSINRSAGIAPEDFVIASPRIFTNTRCSGALNQHCHQEVNEHWHEKIQTIPAHSHQQKEWSESASC